MSAATLKLGRFTASPCGGVAMSIHGQETVMRPSGALWLPETRTLVVADLHLEKGSAFAVRGQLLPPYDSAETLGRLEAETRATGARVVVLLGDSFHDARSEARMAASDGEAIRSLAVGRSLVWIVGNHDSEGPRSLPGDILDEMDLGALRLRHEPFAGLQPGEVAGHLHPCARLVGRGRAVRRRCFATDGQRLILPAFGAYAGGLNIRDRAYTGLFETPPLAIALGQGRAHPLAFGMLGDD
ncbi:MAG: ligase-associated DNA damage response endonuclease PdeM [Caulobacter sp.]|nr:ligase-associated DNA damage response endonuclease PdeM [Caulobacter sp.]